MKTKGRSWKERICALLLALAMVLTGMLPGSTATAEAAWGDPVDVEFKAIDSATGSELTDLTVIVKDSEEQEVGRIVFPNEENINTVSLTEGEEYSFEAIKTGYENASGEFTVESEKMDPVKINMAMSDIQIEQTGVIQYIGDSCQMTVKNPVAGAVYAWQSDNTEAVVVNENGQVTAVGSGSARITASYNGKVSNSILVASARISTAIGLELNAVPDGNNDIESVTCKVVGLPADATGTIKFTVGQEIQYVDVVSGTAEWTYYDQDALIGDVTFVAEYSGDWKYEGSSVPATLKGLYRTYELIFTDKTNSETTPRLFTNDMEASEEGVSFNIEVDADSEKGRKLSYFSSNEDIVRVDEETGKATIVGNGAAYITVKAAQNGYYLPSEKNYFIYSQKVLDISETAISTTPITERTYNGSTEVKVAGSISQTDLENLGIYTGDLDTTKGLSLEFTGDIEGKDVKDTPYDKVTIKSIDKISGTTLAGEEISLSNRIECTNYEGTELGASIKVVKRTVYLGTENFTIFYGDNVRKALRNQEGMVYAIDGELSGEDTGIVPGDVVDMSAFRATVLLPIYNVDVHESIIKPNMNSVQDTTNYHFVASQNNETLGDQYLGSLTVISKKLTLKQILDSINLYVEGGSLYTDENGNTWISGGTLKASFKNSESSTDEADAISSYYDKIILTVGRRDYNLCEEGFAAGDNTVKIDGKLSLQTNGWPPNSTPERSWSFTVDQTDPDFVFGDWAGKTKVSDTLFSAITFNNYQNTEYSIANVEWNDEDKADQATGTETVKQSGVKDWKYYVYKVDSDEQLNEENIHKVIESADWIDTTEDTDSIPVVTGKNGQLDSVQGNYVVLVKITDNVNNTAVYSSNGLILDVTEPTVSITQEDGTPFVSDTYYSDPISYKIALTDGNISSGLERVEIRLFVGDEEKECKKIQLDEKYVDSSSETGYTLDEIYDEETGLNSYDIFGEIKEEYCDSNNLRIEVTAYDQAWNADRPDQNCVTVSQALKCDLTKPEITVSYNNDTDVKNGKYFKSDRVMTIKYKEKNFIASGITFDVKAAADLDSVTLVKDVTLDELSDYGIKVGEKIEDNQSDRTWETYDNKRINTLTLTFNKDNEYYIVPHCADRAGNREDPDAVDYNIHKDVDKETAKIIKNEFVIDKTAPEISVSYTDGVEFTPLTYQPAEGEGVYRTKAVRATVTIDEKNFWLENENGEKEFNNQWNFDGTNGVNAKNENVDAVKSQDYLTTASENISSNWGSANEIRTNSEFLFLTDANYTFTFTYTDLAGNEAVYDPNYFTVDQTNPTGTINLDGDGEGAPDIPVWLESFLDVISFNIFRNHDYEVKFDSEDETSGIKSIEYYKSRMPLADENQVTSMNTWNLLGVQGTQAEKTGSFTVSPDEQFVVYAKLTDYAGHVTYLYPSRGAVADNTKPVITITNLSTPRNGIYKDDVTLHVDVTDPTNGNTYSGIESLWYEVTATGNVNESETTTLMNNSNNRVQSHQNWSGNIVIPADRYNSNDVRVTVHAVDFSGNRYDSETVQLSIDNTDPTIQVTYDLNSPLNERYYNATRTATVTVTERNFDESAVRFNITNTDGTMPSISGWSHSADSGVSDNATHTCYVTFAADGDYTLTLNTTDLAGNDSHYTQVDDFTIDQTDPTIQVSYDNNSDAENGYFNAERTATITVNEHNFNAAEVNAVITARLQGTGVSAPGLGSWSTRGDVHTTTVNFSADADYTFDIDYTDLAGNAAADYQGDTFTVDQTVPEVEFFDIVDKSANKDMVAPGVSYSDINYSENGVKLTLKGAKHDERELTGTRTGIANGESIKMDDFARTKENDDLYTLTAAITDKAGNVTEQSVTFSVNRFGSVYVFSDDTEKLLDDYYAKEEQDLVVTEINVDTLVNNGISYGRDGELVNLEKGSDYTVRESGSDVSWKEYQYTIDKKNFEEEGHYTVTIDSEDRATNVQNNKVKDSDIEFVIDKTAPSVVITGVENGEQYRADSRDMTVNVADNMAMGTVDIYLGDGITPDKSYKASEIERTGGALTYTIGNADEFQDVRAVARDAAGNEAETEGISVLVTSNLLIQYVNNTPLLVGSIIVVLLIAGGACWYFLIFKKKKNEQAK